MCFTLLNPETTDCEVFSCWKLPSTSFPSHLAPLSQELEYNICSPVDYLQDIVYIWKGNCFQMQACCIWPLLHTWIRPGYISPDRRLVLPDETFLAAEKGVCFTWLCKSSQTLGCALFFPLRFLWSNRAFIWQMNKKQLLRKLDIWCHHHRALPVLLACSVPASHVMLHFLPLLSRCFYKMCLLLIHFLWNVCV